MPLATTYHVGEAVPVRSLGFRTGASRSRVEYDFNVLGGRLATETARVRVLETWREEPILRGPEDPDANDVGVRLVIDDDVVFAVDNFRLIDRQAGVLADLYFPILIESAQVAVAGALSERVAVLNDRLLDLLRQVAGDDTGRRRREAEVLEDWNDLRVEILQLAEGRRHRQDNAFAFVRGQQSSRLSRTRHVPLTVSARTQRRYNVPGNPCEFAQ